MYLLLINSTCMDSTESLKWISNVERLPNKHHATSKRFICFQIKLNSSSLPFFPFLPVLNKRKKQTRKKLSRSECRALHRKTQRDHKQKECIHITNAYQCARSSVWWSWHCTRCRRQVPVCRPKRTCTWMFVCSASRDGPDWCPPCFRSSSPTIWSLKRWVETERRSLLFRDEETRD